MIIEEIRMYDDQPPFGADEKCKAAHFRGHPLARNVLGTVDSITRLDVEQMRDYFRSRYSPANITLIGAGKIDFDQLVATAQAGVRKLGAGPDQPSTGCRRRRPRREWNAWPKNQPRWSMSFN